MTKLFFFPAALGLAALFPGILSCAAEPESVPGLSLSADVYGIAEADVEASSAAFATSGSTLTMDWAHWQLSVARHFYQWDDPASFPGMTGSGDPWEFFTRLQLGYNHTHSLSDRWSLDTLVGVLSDYEDELDDSWATYLGGYGTYRAGENWLWFVGLLYTHHAQVSSDFEWVPVLGLAWRPQATEGLSVRLGLPETQIRWNFNPRTRLVLDLNTLEGGVHRLADDSPIQSGGYMEMVNASLTLSLETQLSDAVGLTAGLGRSLEREMTIYDADGNETGRFDIDHALSLHLALRASF